MLNIRVVHRAHGRERHGSTVVDTVVLRIHPSSWVFEMLSQLASESLLRPWHATSIYYLHRALELLRGDSGWIEMSGQSVANCPQIAQLLLRLEERIAATELSNYSRYRISHGFRSTLLRFLLNASTSPPQLSLLLKFKSRFILRRHARPLISDDVGRNEAASALPPLGAIPHDTHASLLEKTKYRLRRDLEKIENACVREIESANSFRAWLGTLPSKHEACLREFAIRSVGFSVNRLRAEARCLPWEILLALHVSHHTGNLKSDLKVIGRIGANAILLGLAACFPDHQFLKIAEVLKYADFGPDRTLLPCAVVLQAHTSWNIGAILSLNGSNVKLIEGVYHIQGIKNKTDDDTPQVIVYTSDRSAYLALQYLTERAVRIASRRGDCGDSLPLFVSRRGCGSQPPHVFSVGKPLTRFIEKYNLPTFSCEQIRVQAIAISSLGPGKIREAQRVAGHKSLATTAHYLMNQALLMRLNAASNLEFQRRFEESVVYAQSLMGAKSQMAGMDRRRYLLYPVGDGTSCRDPQSPPNLAWLNDGACIAEQCHAGGGCANSVLYVDHQRIAEVVATCSYYEASWGRLIAANRDRFLEVHANAMLFNFAFLAFLERGPYRHLVRAARAEILLAARKN